MKVIPWIINLLTICLLNSFCFSQCTPSGTSLITSYNSNNGQRGVMFDIIATNTIYVECFDANLYPTTADYEIYYKPGSFIGSEDNAADWVLIGTTSALTSLGIDIPTPLPIPVNVVIPAGQTYGFYITNTFGGGTSYTDGTLPNESLASNADITITGGVGKFYPFGPTISYRSFNGTVHYTTVVPLSEASNKLHATPLHDGRVKINWQIAHETTDHRYIIERSVNGYSWKSVYEAAVLLTTGKTTSYEWIDQNGLSGQSYYRIKEIDLNDNVIYEDVTPVTQCSRLEQSPVAFPNPATDIVHIRASSDDLTDLRITDVLGREFTHAVPTAFVHSSLLELNLQQIPAGMYILSFESQSLLITKE